MSRFYASIEGEKGPATRAGHRQINSHTRGWLSGVEVKGGVDHHGDDRFDVYATGGSSATGMPTLVGAVVMVNGVPTWEAAAECCDCKRTVAPGLLGIGRCPECVGKWVKERA